MNMKRIAVLLCAGVMALAAVSCQKDSPKPAPPMSPAEQQARLNDAGIASLKEIDPDNWRSFAETCIQLAQNFKYVDEGNYGELAQQMERWFQAVQAGDGYETYVVTLQLSKLKGDCTIKNNVFHYTPSDNPLTLVYEFDGNGKTYKLSFEATEGDTNVYEINRSEWGSWDEHGNPVEKTEIDKAVIPTHVAVHVTENTVSFIDFTADPTVKDLNKDGVIDWDDEVLANIRLSIPGYVLSLDQLRYASMAVATDVELLHGNKSVIAAHLNGKLGIREWVKASLPQGDVTLSYVDGEIRHLGGEVILKGKMDNELGNSIATTTGIATEAEARQIAAKLEQAISAELYYDNNPTLQAKFCVLVLEDSSNHTWYLDQGIHFFDGSEDMRLEDFFNAEDFKPLLDQVNTFTGKLSLYFYKYFNDNAFIR